MPRPECGRRARCAAVGHCTSRQSNTHSTESREVLYPWHPWFGRVVWIYATRVNHGRLVAQCGLEPRHERPGVEVPQWMFDTAVCCQMRVAQQPVASIDALCELKRMCAARSGGHSGPMLQAQHDSLLPEGGADANPAEPAPDSTTCPVSIGPESATLGASAVGGAASDATLAGTNAERTRHADSGFRVDAGDRR